MPRFEIPIVVQVPRHGTVVVEAETLEDAVAAIEADAHDKGWSCRAWQKGVFGDVDLSEPTRLGIPEMSRGDGTLSDYIELLED